MELSSKINLKYHKSERERKEEKNSEAARVEMVQLIIIVCKIEEGKRKGLNRKAAWIAGRTFLSFQNEGEIDRNKPENGHQKNNKDNFGNSEKKSSTALFYILTKKKTKKKRKIIAI